MRFYARFGKRAIDIVLSALALLILWPLMVILWALVRCNLGSPAIFRQERAGRNERVFTMYKFRTMTDARDKNGDFLPDEERMTRLGAFLRSTSLDELPELWNIFRGDMSIIGPRPLPLTYGPYYYVTERARFAVRGGLIPPEVLYNCVTPTWDEQLSYEAEYARNLSFFRDIRVFFAVFKVLFRRYDESFGEYSREALSVERAHVIPKEVMEKK